MAEPLQGKRIKTAGVFLIFLALGAFLVFPVLLDPAGRIAGDINLPGLRGEIFMQYNFCHNALGGKLLRYYHSDLVAIPEGQDLREFIGFSLNLFFYLPILWIGDLIVRYNVLVVLILALNGFSAYLLARHLTRSFWPAFVAGILFLLGPYGFLKLQMGFLQKSVLFWIPLFILAVVRFLEDRRKAQAIRAGVIWSLMLLTYATYGIYALPAGAILVIADLIREPGRTRRTVRNGWPFIVPALLAVLFLMLMLPSSELRRDPQVVRFLPPGENSLAGGLDFGHLLRFYPYRGPARIEALSLGISVLTAGLALTAVIRKRPYSLRFFLVAVFFLLMARGPYLAIEKPFLRSLRLPYYYLASYLPYGKRIGFPIRSLPFYEIAAVVLAGLALKDLMERTRRRWILPLVSISVILAAAAERRIFLPGLFPPLTTSARMAPAWEWLRKQDAVALHIPFNMKGDDLHRYHLLSARTGTAMANHFIHPSFGFPFPPSPDAPPGIMEDYLRRLSDLGVDLILVHPRVLASTLHSPENIQPDDYPLEAITEALERWCGTPVYADPNEFIAYRVSRVPIAAPTAGPGDRITILLDGEVAAADRFFPGGRQPAAAILVTEADGRRGLLLFDLGDRESIPIYEKNIKAFFRDARMSWEELPRAALLISHFHYDAFPPYCPPIGRAPPPPASKKTAGGSFPVPPDALGRICVQGPNLSSLCGLEEVGGSWPFGGLCPADPHDSPEGLAPLRWSEGESSRVYLLTYPFDPPKPEERRRGIRLPPLETVLVISVPPGYLVYSVCSHLLADPRNGDPPPLHAAYLAKQAMDDGRLPPGAIHTLVTGTCDLWRGLSRQGGKAGDAGRPAARLRRKLEEMRDGLGIRRVYLAHCGLVDEEIIAAFSDVFGRGVRRAVPGSSIPLLAPTEVGEGG